MLKTSLNTLAAKPVLLNANLSKTSASVRPALISLTISALLVLSVALSQPAIALSSDRDQPADIEADDIEFDLKKGTRVFTNNVLVVQGTLRIKADKLEAQYADGELQNVHAWGSLARFKQRPDGKPNDVEGWAQKIVVNQVTNILTLTGEAALRQGGNTARGSEIVYNMANDTLKVRGGAAVGVSNDQDSTVKADPNKKLVDPFQDPVPAAEDIPESAIAATKRAQQEETGAVPTQVEPVRSGRSRLIIQPKPTATAEAEDKNSDADGKSDKSKNPTENDSDEENSSNKDE